MEKNTTEALRKEVERLGWWIKVHQEALDALAKQLGVGIWREQSRIVCKPLDSPEIVPRYPIGEK